MKIHFSEPPARRSSGCCLSPCVVAENHLEQIKWNKTSINWTLNIQSSPLSRSNTLTRQKLLCSVQISVSHFSSPLSLPSGRDTQLIPPRNIPQHLFWCSSLGEVVQSSATGRVKVQLQSKPLNPKSISGHRGLVSSTFKKTENKQWKTIWFVYRITEIFADEEQRGATVRGAFQWN